LLEPPPRRRIVRPRPRSAPRLMPHAITCPPRSPALSDVRGNRPSCGTCWVVPASSPSPAPAAAGRRAWP
jgi:hypothetical protein